MNTPQPLVLDAAIEQRIATRQAALGQHTRVLPGSIPHDNVRPINVPGRFDGRTLLEVMSESHPHVSMDQWRSIFAAGRISQNNRSVSGDRRVRGGEQFSHLFPETVEPDVGGAIKIIWEDDAVTIVNKPAPLPMHPSGRFNHNTLISILQSVYDGEKLHLCHRLDANTTGVVLLARSESHASFLQTQFETKTVRKEYHARCHGHPAEDEFVCDQPIGRDRGRAARRTISSDGQSAFTRFRVLARHGDNTSTVIARPITGRTNQIRIHLWGRGHSIVGDPLYLRDHRCGDSQTLGIGTPPMCLHASRLCFVHPQTQQSVAATAPRPDWAESELD